MDMMEALRALHRSGMVNGVHRVNVENLVRLYDDGVLKMDGANGREMMNLMWKVFNSHEEELRNLGFEVQEGAIVKGDGLPSPVNIIQTGSGFALRVRDRDSLLPSTIKKGLPQAIRVPGGLRYEVGMSLIEVEALLKMADRHHWAWMDGALDAAKACLERARVMAEASSSTKLPDGRTLTIRGLGGTLDPHQEAGVAFIMDQFSSGKDGVLLCDDVGQGKTITTLATLQAMDLHPSLVVVPATLRLSWFDEAAKWLPGWDVRVVRKASDLEDGEGDLYITSYEGASRHEELLTETEWACVVLDEAHNVKNGKTLRSQVMLRLVQGSKRILIGGTPMPNRVGELCPQLTIANRIAELGGEAQFKKMWPLVRMGSVQRQHEEEERLHAYLRGLGIMLRRKKEESGMALPPLRRRIARIEVDLAAFNQMLGLFRSDPEFRAAGGLMKLWHEAGRTKVKAAQDWAHNAIRCGEKVVLFAHHKDVIQALAEPFQGDVGVITGDTPMSERDLLRKRFQTEDSPSVLVCGAKAAGEGLTFTRSRLVGIVELMWNRDTMTQLEGRVHRRGQKYPVESVWFEAVGTRDRDMLDLIEGKAGSSGRVLDGDGVTPARDIIEEMTARIMRGQKADAMEMEA